MIGSHILFISVARLMTKNKDKWLIFYVGWTSSCLMQTFHICHFMEHLLSFTHDLTFSRWYWWWLNMNCMNKKMRDNVVFTSLLCMNCCWLYQNGKRFKFGVFLPVISRVFSISARINPPLFCIFSIVQYVCGVDPCNSSATYGENQYEWETV